VIWIIYLALAFAVGYLAAPWVAKLSARLKMPNSVDAQWFLLASVWARPSRLPFIHGLPVDAFDSPRTRALLQAMRTAADLPEAIDNDDEAERLGADLLTNAIAWRNSIDAILADRELTDQLSDRDLWDAFAKSQNLYSDSSDKAAMSAVDSVNAAYQERSISPPHAEFEFHTSPEATLQNPGTWHRKLHRVSQARRLASALSVVAYTAVIPVLLESVTSPYLAVMSWLLMGAGLIVVSFVDHDTMSLDFKAWALALVGGWSFAILANLSHPSWLLSGVAAALAVVVIFEVLNRAFFMLRGVHGQGFGDTLIVLASVGVPAALTGSWFIGYLSLMSALCAAIVFFLIRKVVTKSDKSQPFAFGPWLAVGPPVALLIAHQFPSFL